jgi:protein subunit release factor B
MPYKSLKAANPAIKGIKPRVTLSQANEIADVADALEDEGKVKSPWGVAISQFKKGHTVKKGRWVKKTVREAAMQSDEVGAAWKFVIGGRNVPVSEVLAAYEAQEMGDPVAEEPVVEVPARGAMFEAFWQFAESVKAEMSLDARASTVRSAFYAQFDMRGGPSGSEYGEKARLYKYWVQDVFEDHPEFADAIVVKEERDSSTWAVPYEMADDGTVSFDPSERWQKVMQVWQKVTEEAETEEAEIVDMAESAGGIVSFAEAEPSEDTGLTMTIKLIEPGWGNRKMKRYYYPDMLKKCADRFVGAKMYESEHRNDKDNAGWVSTVNKITGFTSTGAPLAEVGVHDPIFAQRVRNLKAQGNLSLLQCSILGSARVRKGKVNGKKAVIVEEILNDPPLEVDWVRQAGAGGQAVNIAETEEGIDMTKPEDEKNEQAEEGQTQEAETQEQEPKEEVKLKTSEVLEALLASKLPKAGQARIAEREWETADALTEAIKAEEDYIANLVEAGKPFGLGPTEPKKPEEDERSIEERETDVLKSVGLGG